MNPDHDPDGEGADRYPYSCRACGRDTDVYDLPEVPAVEAWPQCRACAPAPTCHLCGAAIVFQDGRPEPACDCHEVSS